MEEEKRMITVKNIDGSVMDVELVTYLVSEDNRTSYLVYSKGETTGAELDRVIYISKIVPDGDVMKLEYISDDNEWLSVQKLLKKIANAK